MLDLCNLAAQSSDSAAGDVLHFRFESQPESVRWRGPVEHRGDPRLQAPLLRLFGTIGNLGPSERLSPLVELRLHCHALGQDFVAPVIEHVIGVNSHLQIPSACSPRRARGSHPGLPHTPF